MIQIADLSVDRVKSNDADGMHQLMTTNAERFRRYFPKTLKACSTERSAKKFVEYEKQQEFLFVIKEKSKVIGLIYIKELDWQKGQGEFAYCMDINVQNKGYMTSVVQLLSDYAFDQLKLRVLQIIVHKDNIGSVRVAEKAGFIWRRTLLKEYTPPNEAPLDMELYELTTNNDKYHGGQRYS